MKLHTRLTLTDDKEVVVKVDELMEIMEVLSTIHLQGSKGLQTLKDVLDISVMEKRV